jgi:hypothetical protein
VSHAIAWQIKDKAGMVELEPRLKPEFIDEIEETLKHGKFVKINDFAEEFLSKAKDCRHRKT